MRLPPLPRAEEKISTVRWVTVRKTHRRSASITKTRTSSHSSAMSKIKATIPSFRSSSSRSSKSKTNWTTITSSPTCRETTTTRSAARPKASRVNDSSKLSVARSSHINNCLRSQKMTITVMKRIPDRRTIPTTKSSLIPLRSRQCLIMSTRGRKTSGLLHLQAVKDHFVAS